MKIREWAKQVLQKSEKKQTHLRIMTRMGCDYNIILSGRPMCVYSTVMLWAKEELKPLLLSQATASSSEFQPKDTKDNIYYVLQ